jgi:TolB-like protein/Flp pilus assembly protein TadD
MAVLYVVAAWLIMQVAEVMVTLAALPEWTGQALLLLLAVGFPIALIFSWFYELTPEGISLEKDVESQESITHVTGRRMDFIVISLLCAAVILFAYDKWWIGPPPEKSIAVLPFENMSADVGQEHFSDGLSDTLIHVLAQVRGLKVTAKTSSFYFKGKNIDVSEIGRKLNVGTILEGSVQKAGNQVRVIAQLVDASDGTHLWSKSFDRDLADIFAVQDEIAREVVAALEVTLLDDEEERLAQRYRPTLEAYEQLILGRQEMAKLTADSLAAAERHFKEAIRLDPDYALAYVSLADTYLAQRSYGGLPIEESLQRQQPLVDKALELDPLSAEAHVTRAVIRFWRELRFPEEDLSPEEDMLKALELNPSSAEIRYLYGGWLSYLGRPEEGLSQIRMAAKLDPMSPSIQTDLAEATWEAGRVEEALTLIRRNIERTPEFPNLYHTMAKFQSQLGQLGEAQRWRQESRMRNPGATYFWLLECIGFLNLGDWLSAEECANQLAEANPETMPGSNIWAPLNVYRGEFDAAIAILQSAHDRLPGWGAFSRILADLVAGQGDIERARSIMADAFPELLADDLELDDQDDLHAAKNFAAILHANGETQQRDVLLLAMEERIATMHRIRGVSYGIVDVYTHVMRGDRDRAIAALREAIDAGWRVARPWPLDGNWWTLRRDWKLESLHQDPEFISIMNELEADIRKQRQWYEDHKDEPLI